MKISSISRIVLAIVSVAAASVLMANFAGIIPDERKVRSETRIEVCQTLASNLSFLVSKSEYAGVSQQLELFAGRNESLISVGLRRSDGALLAKSGPHQETWAEAVRNHSDGCYEVPILSKFGAWGQLEVQFQAELSNSWLPLNPVAIKLLGFLVPLIGLVSYLHLSRILRYLNPAQAVPPRVRQTLDSFAEGVVLLDTDLQVVLANTAFAKLFDVDVEQFVGLQMNEFPWTNSDATISRLPWLLTAETMQTINSKTVRLDLEADRWKIFSVNSSPVLDEEGKLQGVMVALADVTPLERQREELATTLVELHQSQDAIKKQNEELRYLATRDPLTGCVNRRTFFERFEREFAEAKSEATSLSAIMVDIDFFKAINDTYGHARGDEVLKTTGALLSEFAGNDAIVCRYGGEEFSILLPGIDLDEAYRKAEEIRAALAEVPFGEFQITASLGTSDLQQGAVDPQSLLEQADKSLYVAKRNGRNQAIRFDRVAQNVVVDESKISRLKPNQERTTSIPYSAVTALLSALSYRDAQTGAHSTRVATYAAMLAQQYMGPKDVYVVEIAGLLHDIGKIGVPDAILLKPGRLTEEEWSIMERHDRIGVEILNRAFKNPLLTEIVKHHHARFDGQGCEISGEAIPLGARVLTIADSFDAMVSDRPYRQGMPYADAITELRRCSGTQFDPELVETFASLIEEGANQLLKINSRIPNEVMLSISEQIESIACAADQGDANSFLILTNRLQELASQSDLAEVAQIAAHASEAANEDATLETLMKESFELLTICRSLHSTVVDDVNDVLEHTSASDNNKELTLQ